MDMSSDIENYVYAVASNNPTPGGGSVAAIVGSLGVALGSMVTHFTLHRKKYQAVQEIAEKTLQSLNDQIVQLTILSQKDIQSYSFVATAYAMSKTTEEEKKSRQAAIANASENALKAPLEMMHILQKAADLLTPLADFGNQNLDSDMAGSAILTQAAADTAYYCTLANLPFLDDEAKKQYIKNQIQKMQLNIQQKCQAIIQKVAARMNP